VYFLFGFFQSTGGPVGMCRLKTFLICIVFIYTYSLHINQSMS
jgi:hypothetical protein